MKKLVTTPWLRVTGLLVLLAGMAVVQGCGGGGSSSTPPNANPTGYYSNNGTAMVKQADDMTDLSISDLQAMVSGNRIMMMSAANNLLYDGTITSINQSSFSATFTIYDNGQNPVTASATGMITQGSSVTGTLSGTGLGNGTFSLTYALGNSNPAAIARIATEGTGTGWIGSTGSINQHQYTVLNTGVLLAEDTVGGATFDSCEMSGTFVPVAGSNVYTISVTVSNCVDTISSPGTLINGTNYTGLAATRSQTSTDDRMIFSVSNGSFDLNTEFQIF
jgi:asparagine N-glycosylation enzyme membrane subunit Stt3